MSEQMEERMNVASCPPQDETILALEVKEEDLKRMQSRTNTKLPKMKTVPIYIKSKSDTTVVSNPDKKCVIVARPAPKDAQLLTKPVPRLGACGARYDVDGRVIPHSILGEVDNFIMYATHKGDLPQSILDVYRTTPEYVDPNLKQMLRNPVKLSSGGGKQNRRPDRGGLALKNWDQKMKERRRQQNYLSNILDRPVNSLAMNKGKNLEVERPSQSSTSFPIEEMLLRQVSTHMSFDVDETESSRVTSTDTSNEVNKDDNGKPICHVGVPKTIQILQGLTPDHQTSKTIKVPCVECLNSKRDVRLFPDQAHKPDVSSLEVIGNDNSNCGSRQQVATSCCKISDNKMATTNNNDSTSFSQEMLESQSAPTSLGPSLLFAGHQLKWTPQHSLPLHHGVDARVSFDAHLYQKVISYLEITNDGSTAIYYNWTKVHKHDSFDLKQGESQGKVFYFNPNQGVLLPGSRILVPFIFKSDREGLFVEQWRLNTHPQLMGGANIIVSLKGVATQTDENARRREMIECDLRRKESCQLVGDIIHDILSSIVSTARPPSPVKLNRTEKERFIWNNPNFEYSREKYSMLCDLHKEALQELGDLADNSVSDWDMDLTILKKTILNIDEENAAKQTLLEKLNQILCDMSVKTEYPLLDISYPLAYMHVCDMSEFVAVKEIETLENMLPMPSFSKNASETNKSNNSASKASGNKQVKAPPVDKVDDDPETETTKLKEERMKRMREMNFKEKFYTQTFDIVKKTALQLGDILSEI